MSASKFSFGFANSNKSWVEICDEENEPQECIQNVCTISDQGEIDDEDGTPLDCIQNNYAAVDMNDDDNEDDTQQDSIQNTSVENSHVKEEDTSLEDEIIGENHTDIQTKFEKGSSSDNENYDYINTSSITDNVKIEPEEETDYDDSSEHFSYANVVKSSAVSRNVHVTHSHPLSPEKKFVLDGRDFPTICSSQVKKKIKTEKQDNFSEDEISLSSHLDVFHVDSPCKLKDSIDKDDSPNKRRIRLAKRSNFITSTNENDKVMLSSKKIISFYPHKNSETNLKRRNTLKRRRETDSSISDDK